MIFNKSLMLALTVSGGAAVAAVLAVQRNTRRMETAQHEAALQVWENETGSTKAPTDATLPS